MDLSDLITCFDIVGDEELCDVDPGSQSFEYCSASFDGFGVCLSGSAVSAHGVVVWHTIGLALGPSATD